MSPTTFENPTGTRPEAPGFTLLEVMIAMAILAIALVAAFQSQSQSISMSGQARFLTTASLLAQGKMAELEALRPESVANDSGDFGEDYPDYAWQVEVADTGQESLRKIRLTVRNERLVTNNAYTLVLYRADLKT
ncbi:MAG TPA: type II secretion system minor pseudopilin GspI [Syntrophales bacterium]|nr:type II secretion system minor pseudopilin GspI [Syntrophales bacterium]